ncbi:MAG: hypothetical protein RIC80_14885 [Cyclobacteriaceae bacterium]
MFLALSSNAQNAETYFNQASQYYANAKDNMAKRTLDDGLNKFPNDPKLTALSEKIEEDKEKEEKQEQEEQEQQNQDQQNQDQQEQEQDQEQQQKDSEEQQQQDDQEQKEGEQEQQEPQEGEESDEPKEDQPMPSPSEKLEEMNLSEEKAKMILEAMRNSEVQYLQQMKKKATKKADSKKPDW